MLCEMCEAKLATHASYICSVSTLTTSVANQELNVGCSVWNRLFDMYRHARPSTRLLLLRTVVLQSETCANLGINIRSYGMMDRNQQTVIRNFMCRGLQHTVDLS